MDSSSKKINANGGAASEQISDFRRSLPQFLAVAVKNMVLLGYGMTLGFPTIVIPAIKENHNPNQEFSLTDTQISWFSSINLLCVPLGCFMSGILTEATGKRRAMQIVKIPMFMSWMIFYFSSNIYHLYGGLILFGLSGGLMEAPVLTYVAEVTEPRFRGMLAATGPTSVIAGILCQFVMGAFLHWRTVALLSCFMPSVTILALCFVPESPYWLLNKGRVEEARKALAWLRGWVTFDEIAVEFNEIHDGLVSRKKESSAIKSIVHRMVPYTKRNFIAPFALISFGILLSNFSGQTALQTYAVQIFKSLRAPMDEYYATIFFGAAELMGAMICVLAVRYTGKRPLAFVSLIGCGICFLFTATYANIYINFSPDSPHSFETDSNELLENGSNHFGDIINISTNTDRSEFHWWPLSFLLVSALFAHAGIRLIPWMMIGEVFPTSVRSGASGIASGIGYFFAFLTNKVFLGMVSTMTLPGTFWFYSAFSLTGCVILYFIMPETEGKTLFEIEPYFTGKSWPVAHNGNKKNVKKLELETKECSV